jgi:hypothetical protein
MMESEFCKGLKLVGGKRTPVVTKRHHRGNGSHHQAEKRNKAQTDGKQLLMKAASAKRRLDVQKSSGPKMRKQQTSSVQAKPANTRLVLNLIEAACWRSISAVVTSCGWAFSTMCGLQSPAEEGRVFAMFSTYDSGRPRRQGAAWLHAATSSASGSTPFSSSASRARRQLALLAFESFD